MKLSVVHPSWEDGVELRLTMTPGEARDLVAGIERAPAAPLSLDGLTALLAAELGTVAVCGECGVELPEHKVRCSRRASAGAVLPAER